MTVHSTRLATTGVGRAVAQTVLHPRTADQLISYAARRATDVLALSRDASTRELADFALLHAAYSSYEYNTLLGNEKFLPYQLETRVENTEADRAETYLIEHPWRRNLLSANATMVATRWTRGLKRDRLAYEFDRIGSGVLQAMFREGAEILIAWSNCLIAGTMGQLHEDERSSALRISVEDLRAVRNLAGHMRVQARRLRVGLPVEGVWMAGLRSAATARPCLPRSAIVELLSRHLTDPNTLLRRDTYPDLVDVLTSAGVASPDQTVKSLRRAVEEYRKKERENLWRTAIERADASLRGILEDTIDARQTAFEKKFEAMLDVAIIEYEHLDDGSIPGAPDYCLRGEESSDDVIVELKTTGGENAVSLNNATDVVKGAAIVGRPQLSKVTVANPGFEANVSWQVNKVDNLALVEACQFAYGISLVACGEITKNNLLDWLRLPGMLSVGHLKGLATDVLD